MSSHTRRRGRPVDRLPDRLPAHAPRVCDLPGAPRRHQRVLLRRCLLPALAVATIVCTFGALTLPGTMTGNPWLNIIGPTIAAPFILAAVIVVLPTTFGVVFLEQRGLRRCVQLVKGRFRLTAGRTLITGATVGLYLAATAGIQRLLLLPFGDPNTLTLLHSAIGDLVEGLLHLPLFGAVMAATLITYTELRFREDPTTNTRTLAAGVPI